jgi:hypothetical protein
MQMLHARAFGPAKFFRARKRAERNEPSVACMFQEPPMSNAGADNCRAEAEKCRRLAANSADAIEKDALQRMADEWLRLAQANVRSGSKTISVKDAAN